MEEGKTFSQLHLKTNLCLSGVSSKRGLYPISIELRRFLTSFEMTGYENHFFLLPLGKSWKGGVTLFPILGDPSQKTFGTTKLRSVGKGGETLVPVDCRPERSEGSTLFNGGGEETLLELHPKRV